MPKLFIDTGQMLLLLWPWGILNTAGKLVSLGKDESRSKLYLSIPSKKRYPVGSMELKTPAFPHPLFNAGGSRPPIQDHLAISRETGEK